MNILLKKLKLPLLILLSFVITSLHPAMAITAYAQATDPTTPPTTTPDEDSSSSESPPYSQVLDPFHKINFPLYEGDTNGGCGATDSSGSGGSGVSDDQLPGADNKEKIFNYLLGKMVDGHPLQDFQVAGIMGNMQSESGFEPQRAQGIFDRPVPAANWQEAHGGGYGLVQWTPGSKMVDPVTAAGQDANLISVQLDFLLSQLNAGASDLDGQAGIALAATTDIAHATIAFETGFERHRGPPQPDRVTQAEAILAEFSPGGGAGGGSGSGSGSSSCQNGAGGAADGTVPTTVLNYAWPTYHPKPYLTKKPEYAAAITAAQAAGQYIGGYQGVDCGAFVTRVMIDSGWDSAYNYNGNLSDGAGATPDQQRWLDANWENLGHPDSSQLQPGDVAIHPGHTYLFVGSQPGFASQTASASLGQRAPMAGSPGELTDSSFTWYRKRG